VPVEDPSPPPLEEFGDFHIPDGRVWIPGPGWRTRDNGCVAVAKHPSGWVAVADTKDPHTATKPLCYTNMEWETFTAAVRAHQI
jgi:hypothetical protein